MKRIDETVLNDILEGRTARKTNEKMGNKEGGTNATLDGKPEDESEVEGEAELDAEDTMEAVSKDAVMSPEMKAIQAIADKKKKDSRKDDDIEEEGEMTDFIKDVNKRHKKDPKNNISWKAAMRDADDPKKVAAAKKMVAAADKRDAAEYAALHRDDEGKIDASKKNEKSLAEGPKIGPKTPAEDTQDRIRKTRRPRRWSGKYDNEPRQNNLPFPSNLRQEKDRRPNTMPSQATLAKPEPGRDAFEKSEKEKEDADEMSEPGKIDASKKNGDWIKKAVNPKNKGACTPMTKGTCTPARKALAKRFKKAGRKEKKEGGTGWQGKV
tara:strand:+ start:3934 stop:4905 length:972 start_codon:yes stop_codon:yes gene_type:complete